MKYHLACMLPLIILFVSCNATKSNRPVKSHLTQIQVSIDAAIEGQYLAVFETLNPQITSKVTGAFTFSVEKLTDEVVGDVRIANAGPDLIHAQSVRVGNRCPTKDDDLNADGIIDAFEGEKVYGKIFFPLDGDLSSQSSHDGEFPKGDTYGNYIYARVANFSHFMKDLRSHENTEGYFKLKELEPLEIENRVVIVQGVDEAIGLPATVRSVGRIAAYQSLPIVCGVIQKVIMPPGHIDDGATYP